jgi:tRNA(Ile)-lysidine synthase
LAAEAAQALDPGMVETPPAGMTPGTVPFADAELLNLFVGLARFQRVAVAVSGGTDSTALAVLMQRWRMLQPSPPELFCYSVDHGLRPDSAAEADHARRLTSQLGFQSRVLKWQGPWPKTGIQARARRARYDLMAAEALKDGVDVLLTAHHRGDQAETIVMRARRGHRGGAADPLERGDGAAGLSGIPAWGEWCGLRLHRPLLGASRFQLAATLHRAGIDPKEDPSNADQAYERVRTRLVLARQPNEAVAEDALCRFAATAELKRQKRLERAAGFITECARYDPAGFVCLMPHRAAVHADVLATAFGAIIHRIGGQVRPVALARLTQLARQVQGVGDVRTTLGGVRIVGADGTVFVLREARRGAVPHIGLQGGVPAFFDRRFAVTGAQACAISVPPSGLLDEISAGLVARGLPRWLSRGVASTMPCAMGNTRIPLKVQALPIMLGAQRIMPHAA